MLDEGMHLHGHELVHTYWNDIGDLDEWRASSFALLSGIVDAGPGSWNDDGIVDRVLVHPTARVGDGVQLVGPCVLGACATIGDGAILRSAVVLPFGSVAPNTVVASGTVGSLDGLERWARELMQ
jgi:NDP-sugar pyrophosphorylase family protein